ncbi:SDR family NAD(P)-dependent oxidoreductase [Nocardioides pocheonensis]|uniref:SDR family oxidoreductase n=1 Tax=Nocardioides pocheonensis TaxID=661485 RepID=A0A3N0GM60_9ACTN|nr:SDR family oxidoreductase [Nocardioides pocheonensis]RNM13160.1 SDR family oxidoreductase [Nocardioides pocheonensis]
MTSAPAGEYDGLVAIVTGGASGIGAAIAQELHDRGATVAVLDLDPAGAPDGTHGFAVDVTDDAAVRRAVDQVVADHGRLDVVVNNAGIGATGTVEDNSDDQWRAVLEVNVLGVVRVSRAALPYLRRSPAAAIVNVGSIAASAGLPNRALYSASKGAVQALTLAMAADHVRDGVRVNGVNPGTVDTPFVERLLASADEPDVERVRLEARQPHQRLVTPQEVAGAVAYLAGPAAASTVGAVLAVDGGMAGLRPHPQITRR